MCSVKYITYSHLHADLDECFGVVCMYGCIVFIYNTTCLDANITRYLLYYDARKHKVKIRIVLLRYSQIVCLSLVSIVGCQIEISASG